MAEAGAQAALRGYRLQALYTLGRVLEATQDEVIQLEGKEDVEVYSSTGELLEVVQVKAYENQALTLSDLSPDKPGAFFARVLERRQRNWNAQELLVSFGEFGPQMRNAWAGPGKDREAVLVSLQNAGHVPEDAAALIAGIELVPVDEQTLTSKVFEALRAGVTGCDPHAAFALLHSWLFTLAESKGRITRGDLIAKLSAIGRFVSERDAHHRVWYSFVTPIGDTVSDEAAALTTDFYQGVSARYAHIVAGVDIVRSERLTQIEQAFINARLVIVHGASGQGKSALAYRFLHDFVPETWRFEVRLLEDRQQALAVATALLGHLHAVGSPAYVYIDVAPGTVAWVDLAAKLLQFPSVRVLVTVREEDWRRVDLDGLLLGFGEVTLAFDRREAEPMFDRLVARHAPSHVLDFHDAWEGFGGAGPLLEFVYFVRENETLQQRLRAQVNRLRDRVRTRDLDANELRLLRWVSVAAAYGARLDLVLLGALLALPDVTRTVQLLEREYFLRVATDGRFVEGLHPIRSTILADLLTDDALDPWSAAAGSCLPAMHQQDLESFLMYVFARRRAQAQPVLDALNDLEPASWTGVAGVLRALLWLGARDYTDGNRALIEETRDQFGSAWWMILMADIANLKAVSPGLLRPVWENSGIFSAAQEQAMGALRERLMPMTDVFRAAQAWFETRTLHGDSPTTIEDWGGFADVMFFAGHFGFRTASPLAVAASNLALAFETLPIELAANLAFSVASSSAPELKAALTQGRPALVARFQRETQTAVLEDDGSTVRAHFLVDPAYVAGTDDAPVVEDPDAKNVVHQEAIWRIELLRQILPDRNAYGSQGYGHKEFFEGNFDDSRKTGIPIENLPPDQLRRLNGVFLRFGDRDHRPVTWRDHALRVFEARRCNVRALEGVIAAINLHFRRQGVNELWTPALIKVIGEARQAFKVGYPFPQVAVDEFGFIDEGMAETTEPLAGSGVQPRARKALAFAAHKHYRDALRHYTQDLENFFVNAPDALQCLPYLGRLKDDAQRQAVKNVMREKEIREDPGYLPSINLADAAKRLAPFQHAFRQRFAQFFEGSQLHTLEQLEQRTVSRVLAVWLQFAAHPGRTAVTDAAGDAERRFNAALISVRRQIEKNVAALAHDGIVARIHAEDVASADRPDLWITFDLNEPTALHAAFERVYLAVVDALPHSSGTLGVNEHAVLVTWNRLWIVPCVQGHAFGRAGWSFDLLTVLVDPPLTAERWFHFVQQPIPEASWARLGLKLLEHPRLEVVQKLRLAAVQAALLVGHTASLERLSDVGTANDEVLQGYVEAQSVRLNTVLQRLSEAISEIAEHIEQRAQEINDDPELQLVFELLQEIHRELIPRFDKDGQGRFSVADMVAWRDRFQTGSGAIELLYLAWISDLLRSAA